MADGNGAQSWLRSLLLVMAGAVFAAIVGGGVWVGQIQTQVDRHAAWITQNTDLPGRVQAHEHWINDNDQMAARLAVMEQRLIEVNRRLDRQLAVIEKLLDEHPPPPERRPSTPRQLPE